MFLSYHDLEVEQQQPPDYKIARAVAVLHQALPVSRHRVAVAFPGGKDSTVLLDILERYLPELAEHVAIIYGNTGVEYPECVQFVRQKFEERPGRGYEARPGRTGVPNFKYSGQRRILHRLVDDGRLEALR